MIDQSNLVNQVFRRALRDQLQDCFYVLDIGCGPGQYREAVGEGYIGMDVTAEPYKSGVERGTNVVGDAKLIPVISSSLDAAFTIAAIHQVPGNGAAIGEVFRALKPGGKFLLFDYNWRTLRRLINKEPGNVSDGWTRRTQWGWKRELEAHGFVHTQLWLEPEFEGKRFNVVEKWVRLLRNEFRDGGWACVSGVKP